MKMEADLMPRDHNTQSPGGLGWAIKLADALIAERIPTSTVIPHAFRLQLVKELRAAYGVGFRDGEANR